MKKFAILFFIFLAIINQMLGLLVVLAIMPCQSVRPDDFALRDEITTEADILWDAKLFTEPGTNTDRVHDCKELEDLKKYCDDATQELSRKWDRPLVKAFVALIDFYDPGTKNDQREWSKEDKLIETFLKEFMKSETGIRLYFMLGLEAQPIANDKDKKEARESGKRNKETRNKYIKELKTYLKEEFIDTTEERHNWKKEIEAKLKYIEEKIKEEYDEFDKPPREGYTNVKESNKLVHRQIRSYERHLREIWFGYNKPNNKKRKRIAFRHVFAGEKPPSKVLGGFHSWYQFHRLVCKDHLPADYRDYYIGYMIPIPEAKVEGKAGGVASYCKLEVRLDRSIKYVNSILYGSLPEYDFAIFTLCFNKHKDEIKRKRTKHIGVCKTQDGNAEVKVLYNDNLLKADKLDNPDSESSLKTAYFVV